MKSNLATSGGTGFIGLLTLIFITLKLAGFIDWSWWWVLSPTLIGIALSVILFIVLVVVYSLKK